MTSSSKRRRGKSSGQGERSKSSSVQVKCKFCGNTFTADPRLAVCAKCGRPANKPLEKSWLIASFCVPFIGFFHSLMIRPHSPLAGNQGLVASIIGNSIYFAIFIVLDFVLDVF
jgi:ribosomal protein L37E